MLLFSITYQSVLSTEREIIIKSIKSHTAVVVRKTWVLHKPIKNRLSLAYKNIVRKCYEEMFFITNIHFNDPTSSPQN